MDNPSNPTGVPPFDDERNKAASRAFSELYGTNQPVAVQTDPIDKNANASVNDDLLKPTARSPFEQVRYNAYSNAFAESYETEQSAFVLKTALRAKDANNGELKSVNINVGDMSFYGSTVQSISTHEIDAMEILSAPAQVAAPLLDAQSAPLVTGPQASIDTSNAYQPYPQSELQSDYEIMHNSETTVQPVSVHATDTMAILSDALQAAALSHVSQTAPLVTGSEAPIDTSNAYQPYPQSELQSDHEIPHNNTTTDGARRVPSGECIVEKWHLHGHSDCLSRIAMEHLGNGATNEEVNEYVNVIAKANNIQNINLILPTSETGKKMILPEYTFENRQGSANHDGAHNYQSPHNDYEPIRHNEPDQDDPSFLPGWNRKNRIDRTIPRDRARHQTDDVPDDQLSDPITIERHRMEQTAFEKISDTQELARYKQDMHTFEGRARKSHLSSDQVINTYQHLERLLNASGDAALDADRRSVVAERMMHQAAVPTDVEQGNHKTCSVASLESSLYTKSPADVAKFVTDLALTGEYRGEDGTTIKINVQPHDSALLRLPGENDRSHASEIFQTGAVNLYYASQRQSMRYELQDPSPWKRGDTGEKLHDVAGNSTPFDGLPADAPMAISSTITNKKGTIPVLMSKSFSPGYNGLANTFATEQEFTQKLEQFKKNENGKFPIILAVDTNVEPFYIDSNMNQTGGAGGGHDISITDYDAGPPARVKIDNQWSKTADHMQDGGVRVHDLYLASLGLKGATSMLASEVHQNQENGIFEPVSETQLVRLQKITNQIDDGTAAQRLMQIAETARTQWQADMRIGRFNLREQQTTLKEIGAALHNVDERWRGQIQQIINGTTG